MIYPLPAVAVAGLAAMRLVYFSTMLKLRQSPRMRFARVGMHALHVRHALRYRQYDVFMPRDALRCIARVSPRARTQLLFCGRSGQE
jgi:hypothetical protein